MHEAYARALWRLIQKGEKPKEAIAKIHSALEARGRAALLPAVGRAFARLAQRETEKERRTLVVARKGDEQKARTASGAHDAELRIDESLIGGWQFFGEGEARDQSWKTALLSIYNASTRS